MFVSIQRYWSVTTLSWLSSAKITTWGWSWSDLRFLWQQVCEHSYADDPLCGWIFTCSSTLNAVVLSRYCGRPDGGWGPLLWSFHQSCSAGGEQKLFQDLHGTSQHPNSSLRLLYRPPGGLQLHPHVSTATSQFLFVKGSLRKTNGCSIIDLFSWENRNSVVLGIWTQR